MKMKKTMKTKRGPEHFFCYLNELCESSNQFINNCRTKEFHLPTINLLQNIEFGVICGYLITLTGFNVDVNRICKQVNFTSNFSKLSCFEILPLAPRLLHMCNKKLQIFTANYTSSDYRTVHQSFHSVIHDTNSTCFDIYFVWTF